MESSSAPKRNFTTKKEFYRQFRKQSIAYELWLRFMKNPTAVLGLVLFVIIVLGAILAQTLADYDTVVIKINIGNRLHGPSWDHWFGTDELGRDILARILHGARVSLLIGIAAVGVSLFVGGAFGAVAGYYGGRLDSLIMRAMDVFLCLPDVLLAMAIVAAFGKTMVNLVIAIGLSFAPRFARVVRSAVMGVRENEYVEAARSIGARDLWIIRHHILINCMGPIIVQVTLYVASAILCIAALSFLGLGIQAPVPEWGNMLASGRTFMRDYPYIVIAPGLAIFFSILALNLLGDGLRDTLDPRLKQ
ncbi:MAG: ABC transporter permease [Deltaproteobacteria bacterium]|jgi:peptide/nickel transport system permease protein|nr:ABC transporter permease [Deltaproteobacteria bacterium]